MKTDLKLLIYFFIVSFIFAIPAYTTNLSSLNDNYTIIKGFVSGKLTKAKSPYLATEDITIADGDKLIIEPGVIIHFSNDCSFIIGVESHEQYKVYPQLIAKGTESENIIFTAYHKNIG